MSRLTYYIAPGKRQSRIYAKYDWDKRRAASDDYVLFPDTWKEVGLMNSAGKVVCFSGPAVDYAMLLDSQPLMAGVTFTVEAA